MFLIYLGILINILSKLNGNTIQNVIRKDGDSITLFDFTNGDNTTEWIEQSDTVREVGMSKAVFVKQNTKVFQRGIVFFVLNPQPNGAGFAGVRILKHFNLSSFGNISLKLRAQGENFNYKIILRHKGLNDEPNPTYEQYFNAPSRNFTIIDLTLKDFKAYYRGKPVPNADPLDTSNITSIGIQIFGGVYAAKKQFGTSSLEIDWIKAN